MRSWPKYYGGNIPISGSLLAARDSPLSLTGEADLDHHSVKLQFSSLLKPISSLGGRHQVPHQHTWTEHLDDPCLTQALLCMSGLSTAFTGTTGPSARCLPYPIMYLLLLLITCYYQYGLLDYYLSQRFIMYYLGAQIVPDLACGSPIKLAPVSL